MKKLVSVFLCLALTSGVFSSMVWADSDIKVVVNGESIDFTGDQEPVIQNGRTLVPFRAVFEKMGAEVSWFDDIKLCEATYGSITVSIAIGDDKVTIGEGNVIETDVPAQIINGRTMVPLRVLSESIGAEVSWDGETKTVTVTTPEPAGEIPASLEYDMTEETLEDGSVTIVYSYPKITTEYTTTDKMNDSIKESVKAFISGMAEYYAGKGEDADIEADCHVAYNDSGLFSIEIYNGENVLYGKTFATVAGSELTSLDGVVQYGNDAVMDYGKERLAEITDEKGNIEFYAADGGIVFYYDNTDNYEEGIASVLVTYDELDEHFMSDDGESFEYEKAMYSNNAAKDDGTVYITADIEYPVFKGSQDFIEGLNTQFYNSAKKAADSFVNSYKEEAENAYDTATEHLFEPPYNFYGGVEVTDNGDGTVTVKTSYYEVKYGEDEADTYDDTVTIDMSTGMAAME